jgi:alpha-D-ribose 1-methylphosphonate 5-triphosphate synthase subunit PhnH
MQAESIWRASVQQRIFRELVQSFSRPGEVRDLSRHTDASSALRAVLATLMDGETTLADPHRQLAAGDWPLLQARHGPADHARYVLADGRRAPDFSPGLGTLQSPELGATLLIEVEAVGQGSLCVELAGPGIDGTRELRVSGLHPDWLEYRRGWNAAFPLGVDLLLMDRARLVALPRTTMVAATEGAF